jgi:hypothetical protein
MRPEIQTLKAEISADLQAVAELYRELDRLTIPSDEEYKQIVQAYFLHNLYTAFESAFQRIARVFGNGISDQSGWHADLLRRMSLDIDDIRPHVVGRDAYMALDELRRFRHLFRSGYRLHFDPVRLAAVRQAADVLRLLYPDDFAQFLRFLDELPSS